jgi:hypothetical protein
MFVYIFYNCAGQSGGDFAIIIFNIMFGFLQVLLSVGIVKIWIKNVDSKIIIITIILSQVLELIIFMKWGYSINENIKHFKFYG